MLDTDTVLSAVGSTEGTSFGEICGALGADCPDKGDRDGWREFFHLLNDAERDGLVEIDRVDVERNGRMRKEINTVILTAAGADIVRARKDKSRGLLSIEGV